MSVIFGQAYSLGDILAHYWPVFPVALLVSLFATPICRKLALRLGIVDIPDHDVKTHDKPTAYLGGVGILAGLLAGLAVGFWILYRHQSHISDAVPAQSGGLSSAIPNTVLLAAIGVGAAIACVVGLLDDICDLKPSQKFIGQALAAAVLVGVGIRCNLNDLLNPIHLELPGIWLTILSVPIVLFFILGASNSLNLLDGLDGLCAAVTAIFTIAFLLLALILATWGHSPVGDPIRLILCLTLVGATLGFLPLNRAPAKIFMGDAGSMLLGFIAGTLMLLFTERIGRWSVAAIIIFGLPILDTAVALFRRFVNKRPLFVSDRGHIYDQLMDRGLGLKKTLKISYLLAFLYALVGVAVSLTRFRYAMVVFVLVAAGSALLVYRQRLLQIPPKPPRP